MFETSYHFHKVGDQKPNNKKYLERLYTYSFRTASLNNKQKGRLYLIEVEKYAYNIYVIKYYPKYLKSSPKRFNILTGENKCSKIVGTCLQVMLQILSKDKFANFGFMGAHSVDPINNIEEDRHNTKRFRVYKQAIENLFGIELFSHYIDITNSTYIILNNNNDDHHNLIFNASMMFDDLFPELL
jgi:hypothetical protein